MSHDRIWALLPPDALDHVEYALHTKDPSAATSKMQSVADAWAREAIRELDWLTAEPKGEVAHFTAKNAGWWRRSLDLFVIMRSAAFSAFDNYLMSIAESQEDLPWVLAHLYGRCLQISDEILTLLVAGHARGALARWRALEETFLVMALVNDAGAPMDIATRYLDHSVVARTKDARAYLTHIDDGPEMQAILASLEGELSDHVSKYGDAYKKDYGWAEPIIGFAPDLAQIRERVGSMVQQPSYRQSLHGIHASSIGILTSIGVPDIRQGETIIVGPTNYGLHAPLHLAGGELIRAMTLLADATGSELAGPKANVLLLTGFAIQVFIELEDEVIRVNERITGNEELAAAHEMQEAPVEPQPDGSRMPHIRPINPAD